jgi:hypothetical protein
MTDRKPRNFTGVPAVRASVPLWLAFYGPTFSGKTYSALEVAVGIQSIVGGEIGLADTENKRALHYADVFRFKHYPFDPPYDPLSYLDVLHQMHRDGITVAIIDSASHEHEGTGGVLEMHEEECEVLMQRWKGASRDKVQISAWNRPKTEHRKMIQGAQRLPLHIIWCFRAKEKLDVNHVNPKTGRKEPVSKGLMAIGAEDLVYEMAMTALLLPGAKGHPTWSSDEVGERQMIKLPDWARKMLKEDGKPLDRELGARLARWAQGTEPAATPAEKAKAEAERKAEDQSARAEFRRLYESLTEKERVGLGIGKAIKSIDDLPSLDLDRVQRGISVMQAFANRILDKMEGRQ